MSIEISYLVKGSTIASVATQHNVTPAAIVQAVRKYSQSFPESIYGKKMERKLQVELVNLFIKSHTTAMDFANEYGLKETDFLILAGQVIDDPKLIKTDDYADIIFRKLLANRKSLGPLTPKRIVRIIAERYVSEPSITHSGLGLSYGISRASISSILKRGIEQGILEKALADKVASKASYKHSKYICHLKGSYA